MSVPFEVYAALWLGHVGLWCFFYVGRQTESGLNYAEFMNPSTSVHQSYLAWLCRGCAYCFIVLIWLDTFVI